MRRPALFIALIPLALTSGLLAAALVPAVHAGQQPPVPDEPAARSRWSVHTEPLLAPIPPLLVHCESTVRGQVPYAVLFVAIANPSKVRGWGERCNPNVPFSPSNQLRTWLSLKNPGVPYHPLFNGLELKCGCT